jgi:hypothetical protein
LAISGEVNLCLNGYAITADTTDSNFSVIKINSDAKLNLFDCCYGDTSTTDHTHTITDPYSGDKYTVYGGLITGGNSTSNGGGVSLSKIAEFNMYAGTIAGNKAVNKNGGGVSTNSADTSIFNMYGGTISHNYAQREDTSGGFGGGISMSDGSICNIYEGDINYNNATKGGGAIYVNKNSTLNICTESDSGLVNINFNNALLEDDANGGAIYVNSGANFEIGKYGTKYINYNSATKYGGAIFFYYPINDYKITNCEFNYNYSVIHGGAISAVHTTDSDSGEDIPSTGTLKFINSNFYKNTAKGSGGAIHIDTGYLKISGGEFLSNSAFNKTGKNSRGGGGAIFIDEANFEIEDATINNNYSGDYGGAILTNGNIGTSTIKSCTILNNYNTNDDMYGGGTVSILVYSGEILIDSSNISNNSGVGLYVYDEDENYDDNGNDYEAYGTMTNTTISNNGAGGVYLRHSYFTMESGLISDNYCNSSGGGIYIENAYFTMNGGTISGNTARYSGGGIAIESHSSLTINGGTISGNTAGTYGGGICVYNPSSLFYLNGGTISGNTAGTYGGGIYLEGNMSLSGNPIVKDNKLENNTDSNVYLWYDKKIYITGELTYSEPIGLIFAGNSYDSEKEEYYHAFITDYIFTSGYSDYMANSDPNKYFLTDSASFEISLSDAGEVKLVNNSTHHGDNSFIALDKSILYDSFLEYSSTYKEAQYFLTSGNYYLTNDLALDKTINIVSEENVTLCLNGHVITRSSSYYFPLIRVNEQAYLDLYDCCFGDNNYSHTITDPSTGSDVTIYGGVITGGNAQKGGAMYICASATVNMYSGNISGNCYTGTGTGEGAIFIKGGTFNMFGGNISYNQGCKGFIAIASGTFNLVDGEIYNNNSTLLGGIVYLTVSDDTTYQNNYPYTFTMSGGKIYNNNCTGNLIYYQGYSLEGTAFAIEGGEIYNNTTSGTCINYRNTNITGTISDGKFYNNTIGGDGFLYLYSDTKFNINDGEIYNNTISGDGTVFVGSNSSFTMSGGKIYNNTVGTYGGGVYLYASTFNLSGGSITGNIAGTYGGGIYMRGYGSYDFSSKTVIYHYAIVNMSGGSITENAAGINGGGVYVGSSALINLSGNPIIMKNTAGGLANNIFLINDSVISIDDELNSLAEAAYIGITLEGGKGKLTSGYAEHDRDSDGNIIDPNKIFFIDVPDDMTILYVNNSEIWLLSLTYNITYTWSEDIEGQATATYTCVQDKTISGTLPATVTFLSSSATCEADGVNTYIATVPDLALVTNIVTNDTHTYNASATGHDYSVAFTWADTTPSATLTCAACDAEVTENITVNITSAVTTAATCTSNGITTYIATASYDGTDYNDTATGVKSVTTDMIEHDYDYEGGKVTTDPTCTEMGYTTYTCKVCAGEVVKDYVNALGHSYKATVTPATCTESGYTTYTCERCGDTYTEDISALGHKTTYVAANAATCEEDGNVEYYYCERCNNYFGVKTENDEKVVDYTKILDSIIDKATGHSYVISDSWTWNEEDFTDDVTATFVCSECDDTITQSATPTVTTVNATCTEDGKTIYLATVTYDGKSYSDTKEVTIAKLDHKNMKVVAAVEATCTTSGNKAYRYCPDCGRTFAAGGVTTEDTTINIPASGHAYRVVFTWNDDGTVATCKAVCANDESHISSLTVNMSNKVVAAATCTDEGIKTYTAAATYSGVTYKDSNTKSVAKIAHTLANTRAKAASCTDAGNSEYWSCSTCGKYFTDSEGAQETQLSQTVIAAVGHNPSTDNIKWTWAQDYSSACATLKCATCGKNVIDTATTASEEGDDGTSYTATITIGGQTYTSEAVKPEAKADNNVDSAKTDSATAASSSPMPIAAIITLSGCLVLIVIEALAVIVLFRAIRKE